MSKNRIMIVEDDNIVATDIQTSLEQAGHEVVCMSASGEDAVEEAGKHLPDIVLMDILLKENMDGIEAARIIYDRLNIPVVFLTAYSGSLTVDRAKTAHPYGYIVKPFDDHMLLTTIEIALYKHRAEKEAERKNQLFRQLLSAIDEAVLAVDPETGTFLLANAAAEKLLNRTHDDAGLTLGEIVHQAYGDEFRQLEDTLRQAASGRTSSIRTRRTLVNRKTGKSFEAEECVRAIRADAMVEALSLSLRPVGQNNHDIRPSGRKDSIYSLLYSNLFNRIRVPLDAIIGFTNLLSQTPMAPDQNGYVKTICESGREAAEIIDDIIMLAQLEPDKPEPEHISFDLERLVKNVIEQAQLRFLQHNVAFSLEYDAALNQGVGGMPSRIRQALAIMINFMADILRDIEITVRVSMEERSADQSGAMVAIAVKRPAEEDDSARSAVIDRLLQEEKPQIKKLDDIFIFRLTMAVNFVRLLGGRLRREKSGEDDSLVLTLALELTAPIVEQDITPLSLNELKGKKVVIVDDNLHSCQVLETYCRSCGMTVVLITDTLTTALDYLSNKNHAPDIVLCDIMTGDGGGYEFARRLRDMEHMDTAKLLAVTSDISPGAVARSRKSGFDAYLAKPISKGDFFRVVQTTMGDRRQAGQIVTRHLSEELSLKGVRVLLAESNNVRMNIIDVLLNKFGCEVDKASCAGDVFGGVAKNDFDVCLLDLEMPELGGHEAVIRIRQELAPALPVIAMSQTPVSGQCAKLAGVRGFLLKPVDADQMRTTILKCISHNHMSGN